jgi:hypothetical protein
MGTIRISVSNLGNLVVTMAEKPYRAAAFYSNIARFPRAGDWGILLE